METVTTAPAWTERIEAYAKAVGKTPEEITAALQPLVGDPTDEALATLSDPTFVPVEDIKKAFTDLNIPSGVFNKSLTILRGPQPEAPVADAPGTSFEVILPSIPEDSSFLEALKVGGVLKVDTLEVISAVKAAIANKVGLYDLPDTIKKAMEKFAEEQDEPVTKEFFELQKLVTAKKYGEVLSALGADSNLVSETRKAKFLQKLDENLWGALRSFNTLLGEWQQAWMNGAANPTLIMASLLAGTKGTAMPTGMMSPPPTNGLHDEAEAVVNSINKVFGGMGIPVARALAYDATRIKGVLQNPSLPASIGAANREQMLKMLNVSVGSDYVRLEQNITRFALAIMEFNKIADPNDELMYLGAMVQLGAFIPWDKLDDVAGIGKRGSHRL